jgi:hypothetical protein
MLYLYIVSRSPECVERRVHVTRVLPYRHSYVVFLYTFPLGSHPTCCLLSWQRTLVVSVVVLRSSSPVKLSTVECASSHSLLSTTWILYFFFVRLRRLLVSVIFGARCKIVHPWVVRHQRLWIELPALCGVGRRLEGR